MKNSTKTLIVDYINKTLTSNSLIKGTEIRTRFSYNLQDYFTISKVGNELMCTCEINGIKDYQPLKAMIDTQIKNLLQPFVNYMIGLEHLGGLLTTENETFELDRLESGRHIIVISGDGYQKLVHENLEYTFSPVNEFAQRELKADFDYQIALIKKRNNIE